MIRAPIWTSHFWQAFEKLIGQHDDTSYDIRVQTLTNSNTERVNAYLGRHAQTLPHNASSNQLGYVYALGRICHQ